MPGSVCRRLCWRPLPPTLALIAALIAPAACAGLFDDEEARRQTKDLAIKTNERLDTLSRGQIELANQIQVLREENARLRGQVETLNYELESSRKRQQDFYVDLDGRLRKIETPVVVAQEARPPDDPKAVSGEPTRKSASDPAAETREYEAALNLFRANKIKEAAAAFDAFTKAHTDSALAPSAYYWLGNAYYAQRDCRRAIEAQRVVVGRWPASPKAPEALLNISTCQLELGDAKGAKSTQEALISKYPDSTAASTARQRLKK